MTAPERDTFSPWEKAVNADGEECRISNFQRAVGPWVRQALPLQIVGKLALAAGFAVCGFAWYGASPERVVVEETQTANPAVSATPI